MTTASSAATTNPAAPPDPGAPVRHATAIETGPCYAVVTTSDAGLLPAVLGEAAREMGRLTPPRSRGKSISLPFWGDPPWAEKVPLNLGVAAAAEARRRGHEVHELALPVDGRLADLKVPPDLTGDPVLAALAAAPRGLVECPLGAVPDLVVRIARAVGGFCLLVVPNCEAAGGLGGRLEWLWRKGRAGAGLSHVPGLTAVAPWRLAALRGRAGAVVVPDAQSVCSNSRLKALFSTPTRRVYGFLPPGIRLSRRDWTRLAAGFGRVLYRVPIDPPGAAAG